MLGPTAVVSRGLPIIVLRNLGSQGKLGRWKWLPARPSSPIPTPRQGSLLESRFSTASFLPAPPEAPPAGYSLSGLILFAANAAAGQQGEEEAEQEDEEDSGANHSHPLIGLCGKEAGKSQWAEQAAVGHKPAALARWDVCVCVCVCCRRGRKKSRGWLWQREGAVGPPLAPPPPSWGKKVWGWGERLAKDLPMWHMPVKGLQESSWQSHS